jgi:hypothetical protein
LTFKTAQVTDDLLDVTLAVTAALDQCGIPYTVGGSLASSVSGEPRASLDADVVVQMRPDQIDDLVKLLGDEFYSDSDAIRRAIDAGSSTNLVHRPTGIKVDLFPAASFLDHQQLLRRQLVKVATDPDRYLYVHSPEDILLQKLHWYRLGGGTSERQWRDVVSIVLVQGSRIDREYVSTVAEKIGVSDLVQRAYSSVTGGRTG